MWVQRCKHLDVSAPTCHYLGMSQYILFLLGFISLIKGANLLVDGASSIAKRLNVSDLVIGLTLVAFGTSAPELFVNIVASVRGNSAIAIGNVVGSNIANILLILGISSVIYPLSITKGTTWKEIPLAFLAAVLLMVLVNDRFIDQAACSFLSRTDGIAFLVFFIIFLSYSFSIAKRFEKGEEYPGKSAPGLIRPILLLVFGLILLNIGGVWVVNGAVTVARNFSVSEYFISLTIIALGTSLPELATSAVAAYRKNAELAVGNVVGSNIFNIFFILGISSFIRPLQFTLKNNIDLYILIFANILLFSALFTGRRYKIDRAEGILFIILYLFYIAYFFIRK